MPAYPSVKFLPVSDVSNFDFFANVNIAPLFISHFEVVEEQIEEEDVYVRCACSW
jgi:hypothetical protein